MQRSVSLTVDDHIDVGFGILVKQCAKIDGLIGREEGEEFGSETSRGGGRFWSVRFLGKLHGVGQRWGVV